MEVLKSTGAKRGAAGEANSDDSDSGSDSDDSDDKAAAKPATESSDSSSDDEDDDSEDDTLAAPDYDSESGSDSDSSDDKPAAKFIVGSGDWTRAPCLRAPCLRFVVLTQPGCTEVTKPEWWNDEGLKTMSARVLKAAPNEVVAINMRAVVLSGLSDAWEVGPRSAAELKEAAVHFERAAALCDAPAQKSGLAGNADWCHTQAATM